MNARHLAVVGLILLLVGSVAGPVVAQSGTPDSGGEYTLDELQKSGEMRNDEFPSLRVLGEGTGIWAVNYEAGPLKSFGAEGAKTYLEPEDKIERNRIRFTASHPWDGESRNYTFKTIYWHQDTRTVQTENGSESVPFANVTGEDTSVLTFDSGMQKNADLSLRPHYDQAEQVTILMLDDDGDELARWGPYTHKSVQTTASLPFDPNWSSFMPWFFMRFIATFSIGGVLAVVLGFKMPKEAGKGPGKGIGWWVVVSGILMSIALFGWWTQVVALIVSMPYLLAVPPILLVFVSSMELSNSSMLALLEDPTITTVKDPLGEDAPEIEAEAGDTARIIDVPEGVGFIKDGSIRAFLARYFAGVAVVPESDIPKEHPYGGNSSIQKKFYVKDFNFTPARWTWSIPSLRRRVETDDGVSTEFRLGRLFMWVVAIAAGAAIGMRVWNLPLIGAVAGTLPILASGATALPAEVDIEFADGEFTSAKAARLSEQKALAKWQTFEDLAEAVGETETAGYDIIMDTLDEYRDQVNERLDTLMHPNRRAVSADSEDKTEVRADGE